MTQKNKLWYKLSMRGIWTALITPFDEQNKLDLSAWKRILQDQAEAGVTGVVPCGTTGESPTLSLDERKTLVQTALLELKGTGVQVAAGTGSNDTAESVHFSHWASEQGVAGVVVVTPYYNKPTQAGLEYHYRAIANAVKCKVMLYNVPGRTGVSLAAETIAQLSTHPQIRSIKEATGNPAFTSEILDCVSLHRSSIDVLSGDDATFLSLLSVGAVGIVSVASNLFPRAMVAIQKFMDSGQHKKALELHQHFYPLFKDLFIETNPGPIKYAMAYAGWCQERVRPPLASLTPANIHKLQATLERCGIKQGVPA